MMASDAGERPEADDVDPDQRPDQHVDAADGVERRGATGSARSASAMTLRAARKRQGQGQHRRDERAEKGDGDGLEQRHARRARDAPSCPDRAAASARVDLAQAVTMPDSETSAAEEAEVGHAEQQQDDGQRRPRGRRSRSRPRWRPAGPEMLRMAVADGREVDRPGAAGVIALSSRPIRRWRTALGDESITITVTMISTRMARDVGVVELADRLDQVLADAAGADEAHDGGAAHIDLEAQQRVADEVRQRPAAGRAKRMAIGPRRAGRRRRPRPASCRCSRPPRRTACRARPVVWMATASTPAIGPSPKAITKISAKTSSGTVRQNSQKRAHGEAQPAAAAPRLAAARKQRHEARRARPAACRHRRSAASRRAAGASAAGPRTTRRGRSRRAGRTSSMEQAARCSSVKRSILSKKLAGDRPRPTSHDSAIARPRAWREPSTGCAALGARREARIGAEHRRRSAAAGGQSEAAETRMRRGGWDRTRRRVTELPRVSSSACAARRRT